MSNPTSHENLSFQNILITTEELILEKGCRNTTLKDIIERTGLSKGAIYHYVASKDELYGLILKTKIEQMNEKFNQLITQSMETAPDAGRFGMATQYFHSRQNSNDVGNLIFVYLLSQDDEKVKSILKSVYQYSKATGVQWIELGQQNGVIPPNIDAEKMATLFMTFSYGLRVTQILSSSEDEQVATSDIFKLLIRTLS
ncbi:TetR/AcrR family transcriptional regulator [Neobacillus sp. LXY-1]|uniref:TetR/AcrR family transcriptional regulator n=1 Tax=Neobacillus sp. LXY-1 TaxID=3379133 RepID=UPI003EE03993